MQQSEIYKYAERFFTAKDCLIHKDHTSGLKVTLTPELDEKLMNRVFYWYYMNKIGGEAEPMTVTFDTDPENDEAEHLYFGAPRLHQLFNLAAENGRFAKFYDHPGERQTGHEPLYPWLMMTVKIINQCDLRCDRLVSAGLQMLNGTLLTNFQDLILSRDLQVKIPDFCYTMRPLISPPSAIARIENFIRSSVEKESFQWAEEAKIKWGKDLSILEQLYKDHPDDEALEHEKKALKELYEPKILVQTVQAGFIYLKSDFIQSVS